jgi:thiamine pyrophosphokinase
MRTYPLPQPAWTPDVVILAGGAYPSHPLPLALLAQAARVVCCDGAGDAYIAAGGTPTAIVGDGDSLSATTAHRFADRLFLDPLDQDTNDQTKAVRFCVRQGWRDLLIVGATGKREDHTLGNVSLLTEYMDVAHVQSLTDYGIFTPANTPAAFEARAGMQVSIFNFGCGAMAGEGLRYPLRPFDNWWQGTLNEATSHRFVVHADGKYLVYRATGK